jgi:predicted membrane-bound mannosyltransferase
MFVHHRQLAASLLFFALPCTYFLKLKSNADICMLFNSKRNPVGIMHLFALQACSEDAFHKLHTQNWVTDMQKNLIGLMYKSPFK